MMLQDDSFEEVTTLTPDRISELLEVCLGSTYFSYQGEYYEQREGAAMGSPVSAIVANLYMEFFEKLAISTSPVKPRIWKRYVDDIYCIIEKGSERVFLNHLNSIRPQIQFTMELPVDGTLAFLDCSLHRRIDGRLEINVHRKKTHTDRYLNFRSHHPSHVKRAVVQSLSDRAERIVNTKENLESERTHLNKVLVSNIMDTQSLLSTRLHLDVCRSQHRNKTILQNMKLWL